MDTGWAVMNEKDRSPFTRQIGYIYDSECHSVDNRTQLCRTHGCSMLSTDSILRALAGTKTFTVGVRSKFSNRSQILRVLRGTGIRPLPR